MNVAPPGQVRAVSRHLRCKSPGAPMRCFGSLVGGKRSFVCGTYGFRLASGSPDYGGEVTVFVRLQVELTPTSPGTRGQLPYAQVQTDKYSAS
jgi:hypothetical protein